MIYNFLFISFAILFIEFGNTYVRRNDGSENNLDSEFVKHEQSNAEMRPERPIYIAGQQYIAPDNLPEKNRECWMSLDAKTHFETMDKLDDRYANVRKEYQDAATNDDFDGQMLAVMLKSRGAAEREMYKVGGDTGLIPAGINLGGFCMMRMPNSLLFYHRMKLRNNTHFRVTHLHNDLQNMVLEARISLNDLHLLGSYDRSTTSDNDPSILYYTPTYGQVEFLLKNVQYSMEGRYRLNKDRLTIDIIISNLTNDDVMMTYLNNKNNQPIRLQRKNIGQLSHADDFLSRLKTDLDEWLKDYFNDYLMYFGIDGNKTNTQFQQYDKEKATELNDYTDHVIGLIVKRLHKVQSESVELPHFKIFSSNGMELLLKKGVLRGLDSIYRRSVASGKKENTIRKINAVVGFSNLKATYQYEARVTSNEPKLSGAIILSADELTARMDLAIVDSSDSFDLTFEFLEQTKPESLTIEGAANRVISNFKYLLEQHVIAIMSNILIYNVKLLGSVAKCVPRLRGYPELDNFETEEETTEGSPISEDETAKGNPNFEDETIKPLIEHEADIINSIPTEIFVEMTTLQSEELDQPNEQMQHMYDPADNDQIEENTESKPVTKAENLGKDNNVVETTENQVSQENYPIHQSDDVLNFKKLTKGNVFLNKKDSVEFELPSDEDEHKKKMHLEYSKNWTLTKIDSN